VTEYGVWPMIVVGTWSAAVMFTIFAFTNRRPWPGIAVEEALARGATIVDVRAPEEFGAGAIAGAVNVPLDVLGARIGELDQGRAVIVYCATGQRSARAAAVLRSAGFSVTDAGTFQAFADHLQPI
jgi:phage shock protein E